VGSLMMFPEAGIVVAVMSNISHADTPALALKVAEVFAQVAPRSLSEKSSTPSSFPWLLKQNRHIMFYGQKLPSLLSG
jgi:hypothetical protein